MSKKEDNRDVFVIIDSTNTGEKNHILQNKYGFVDNWKHFIYKLCYKFRIFRSTEENSSFYLNNLFQANRSAVKYEKSSIINDISKSTADITEAKRFESNQTYFSFLKNFYKKIKHSAKYIFGKMNHLFDFMKNSDLDHKIDKRSFLRDFRVCIIISINSIIIIPFDFFYVFILEIYPMPVSNIIVHLSLYIWKIFIICVSLSKIKDRRKVTKIFLLVISLILIIFFVFSTTGLIYRMIYDKEYNEFYEKWLR